MMDDGSAVQANIVSRTSGSRNDRVNSPDVNMESTNTTNPHEGNEAVDDSQEDPVHLSSGSLDIDGTRQEEEKKNQKLAELKSKIEELNKSIGELSKELNERQLKLQSSDLIKDIEEFFQAVLNSVSSDQDRTTLIERSDLVLEAKVLTLPLRMCAFNYASDYVHGANQLFFKLKEEVTLAKTTRAQNKVTHLESSLAAVKSKLAMAENDEKLLMEEIEELVTRKRIDDELESIRLAKKRIEDQLKAQKGKAEESLQTGKLVELERLRTQEDIVNKPKDDRIREAPREQNVVSPELNENGHSKPTEFFLDDEMSFFTNGRKREADTQVQVKKEVLDNNKTHELLKVSQKSDTEDTSEEKRQGHELKRALGETDISDDDVRFPGLDEISSDEEPQNTVELANLDGESHDTRETLKTNNSITNISTTLNKLRKDHPVTPLPSDDTPVPHPKVQAVQVVRSTTQQSDSPVTGPKPQPSQTQAKAQLPKSIKLASYLDKAKVNGKSNNNHQITTGTINNKRVASSVFVQDPRLARKKLLQQQSQQFQNQKSQQH